MTYDLLCSSKACSMTFRKNLRYPTTPGGTACGRAGLRYARKQAAVYAGLRCVRRQCAQAGDCICRLAAGASSRHRRPSPAEIAAAEFAGLCARANWGAVCRRAYTQIPKAGEASRRRRAAVRRRAYTQMPPSVYDCGRRSTVRTHSVRNQALSVVTGDNLDEIAHLRADGRLHTQAWCANGCSPRCATAADEPPRKSTGV